MSGVWRQLGLAALLAAASFAAHAQGLLMARSVQAFPEAMATLQRVIGEHGYTVSRVQRVDVGLTRSGFETDRYRIVFFGKLDEVRGLAQSHPELVPYLPLNIAIFAEGEQTVLVAANPQFLARLYPEAPLRPHFVAWERDLRSILEQVGAAE